MDTGRLRKAFKYPEEPDGSEDSHEEMDEEEQEKLISDFRVREAQHNARYNLIFSVLPLTVIPAFLYYLFSSSPPKRSGTVPLFCLLAVTSLMATAYTMRFIRIKPSSSSQGRLKKKLSQKPLMALESGPVAINLPWLNPGITMFLFLVSWLLRGKESSPDGLWMFLWLPGILLGMIMVARKTMAEIEAGIGELDGMRYGYKGA